jgi:hypothetical protein
MLAAAIVANGPGRVEEVEVVEILDEPLSEAAAYSTGEE